jgi:predicted TPR repeat methyltransferase
MDELNVLEIGAGNGVVGETLKVCGVHSVVGVDILEEAKDAAERDRPEVYKDYLVVDLSDMPEPAEEKMRERQFNCLVTVAALGFGDIPPQAFAKALDLIEVGGWIAFNIKEDFVYHADESGFAGLIEDLMKRQVVQTQAYRRYRHRFSITGEPLYYVAYVARKLRDIPDEILQS